MLFAWGGGHPHPVQERLIRGCSVADTCSEAWREWAAVGKKRRGIRHLELLVAILVARFSTPLSPRSLIYNGFFALAGVSHPLRQ